MEEEHSLAYHANEKWKILLIHVLPKRGTHKTYVFPHAKDHGRSFTHGVKVCTERDNKVGISIPKIQQFQTWIQKINRQLFPFLNKLC